MSERVLYDRKWKIIAASDSERREWASAESVADFELNMGFRIQKNDDLKSNDAEITIYNLSPESRAFLKKNTNVELHAGYADASGLIFKGLIEFIGHTKQGPNWETKFHCRDGALAWRESGLSVTFKKDTPIEKVIEKLADRITEDPKIPDFRGINKILRGELRLELRKIYARATKDTSKPKRTNLTDAQKAARKAEAERAKAQRNAKAAQAKETFKLDRARTIRGLAMKYLEELCKSYGLRAVLEDQSLSILPINGSRSDTVIYLTANSGLIGSPEPIENGGWRVVSLLRHEFKLFAEVAITSAELDGVFRIRRIEHSGDRIGSDWFTILEVEPVQ